MRILGIELGAWSVKAVEMESKWRRLEILDLHEIRLPVTISEPIPTYKKTVENLLGRLPSIPDKIVTSLPAAHSSLRFMHLPIKQRRKVEQTYRFELEDSLPFGLDDSIVEHAVSKIDIGNMVLAGIAPKHLVISHLEWLEQIGLDPDWLTFEGMGLLNFFLQANGKSNKDEEDSGPEITLLLDVGHSKSNLSIINDKRVEFFRSISWGGSSITQALAGAFDLDMEAAEEKKLKELKLDVGNEDTGSNNIELYSTAAQSLSPLMTDIQHSIVTYRSQRKLEISRVILAGGTAKTPGFAKFISQQTGRPASLITDTEHMSLGKNIEPEKAINFGEVTGRGIVFSRKAPLLFNFRKQELAKQTSLTEAGSFLKDPNVVTLIKFACVLFAILTVHIMFATPIAKKSAKEAEGVLKKAFQLTFRGEQQSVVKTAIRTPKQLKRYIDRKQQRARDQGAMMVEKRTPMLKILKSVTGSFSDGVKVDVNKVKLDDRSILLEGVLYSGNLDPISEAIKKLEGFEKVRLVKGVDGKRFTIQGEIDREVN